MLETIREIGVFMIAAQAVVHFAPREQYERYIKSISGVIILLLFLKPFLQMTGEKWEEPDTILQRMTEFTELPAFPEAVPITGAGDAVVTQMEEEIKALLNRELEEESCYVQRVAVRFDEGQTLAQEGQPPSVEIELGQKEEKRLIVVEEIAIGETTGSEERETARAYRRRFACLLGIPEENVEVRVNGRG